MADPFDTLGVEPRFDLDVPALEQRHRDLSRALHPDRYTGAPAAERRLALGRAIDANEAFRALKDPVRRAEALLARAGVPVGETREPKPPASLLMEMMEAREELSDAARAKDLARVAALAATMHTRRDAVLAKLGDLLAPVASSAHGDLAAALPTLGELRYIRRFLDEVAAIQEDLAP
jgi:molecular chaperone HscB